MMKILHAPVEVAGQVGLEVAGLRTLGHPARRWTQQHAFDFQPGPDRRLRQQGWPGRLQAMSLVPLATRFDVVHLHGGASLLPRRTGYADVRWLRRRGVKVVQHFCGSDARLPDTELVRNPWYVNSYGENEATNLQRIRRWAELHRRARHLPGPLVRRVSEALLPLRAHRAVGGRPAPAAAGAATAGPRPGRSSSTRRATPGSRALTSYALPSPG